MTLEPTPKHPHLNWRTSVLLYFQYSKGGTHSSPIYASLRSLWGSHSYLVC